MDFDVADWTNSYIELEGEGSAFCIFGGIGFGSYNCSL